MQTGVVPGRAKLPTGPDLPTQMPLHGSFEAFERPRWLRDLLRFLPLKSQFVLSGNIRDHQLAEVAPGSVAAQPLLPVLAAELRGAGYAGVIAYDPVSC